MDKKQISAFIDDPSLLDSSTLTDITEVVNQFPFCQSLRILQLINLKNVSHINYHTQLKVAAIYSADRKKLYELLHDDKSNVEKSISEKGEKPAATEAHESIHKEITPVFVSVEPEEITDKENIGSSGTEEFHIAEIKLPLNAKPTAAEIIENRLREITDKSSRDIPAENASTTRDISKPDPLLNINIPETATEAEPDIPDYREVLAQDADPVSRQQKEENTESLNKIFENENASVEQFDTPDEPNATDLKTELKVESETNVVESVSDIITPETKEDNDETDNVLIEEIKEPEFEHSDSDVEQTNDVTQVQDDDSSQNNLLETDHHADELQENISNEDTNDNFNIIEKHSFTDWLKKLNRKTENIQSAEKVTEKMQVKDVDPKPTPQKDHPAQQEAQSKSPIELIEKFIKSEPKIEAGKAEFFSPSNMARNSSVEHEDVFSETLADILYQQELYEKSRSMYRKLMLIYPEKSSYFAARIKEIDEIINNK